MNLTWGNLTVEEYLLRARGPKHLPLSIVLPITVVYAIIFVTGVIGNMAVCIVIIRNAAMHTATNYYLFSLAVSDLTLLLLGLPNDLSVFWQQYPWALGVGLCKFRALVSEMTSYTSVLTIVAFSTERYLAICHPLHSYTMSGLQRAVKIITVLWFISLISAAPFAVFTSVNYIDFPPGSGVPVAESAFCAMLEDNIPPNWPVYELSSLLFFIIPLFIIVVLYVRIGVKIRRRSRYSLGKSMEGAIHGEKRHSQSRKSIIRMLTAVVIAFFLCWAPFHLQRLIYLYAKQTPNFLIINEWMYYITGCFYYFSSTVNPILYNLMSVKYRLAFKQTLCGKKVKIPKELNSSFRETSVATDGGSPRWQRHSTLRNKSKINSNKPSSEVIVLMTSNPNPKKKCFTTVTKEWPKTLLRVTMGTPTADKPQNIESDEQENLEAESKGQVYEISSRKFDCQQNETSI